MVPVNLLGRTLVVSWFPEGVRPCATWNSSCIQLSCWAFHLLTALSPISLIQLEHKRTERIKWSLPHPLNISIYSSHAHHSQPRPNLTETKEHFNQSHSVLKFILPVLQDTPSSKVSLTTQLYSSKPSIPIFLFTSPLLKNKVHEPGLPSIPSSLWWDMAAGLLLPSRRMWSPDPTPPPDHLLLSSQQLLEIFCSFRGALPHSTFSLPRPHDAHRPILAHSASLAVHSSQRLQRGKKELRFTLEGLCRHYWYKIAFGTFQPFCIFVNPQAWELALSMTPGCLPLLRGETTEAVFSPWSTFFKFLSAHQLVSSHTSPEGRATH